MSESQTPQAPKAPSPKPRNPVEKLIVRGFIVVLLVLVGIEGFNWQSHSSAASAITKKLKAVEADANAPEVTEADIKKVLGDRQPIRTEKYPSLGTASPESKKLEIYSWFSLNPARKRELWVHYGRIGVKDQGLPTVIYVSTDDQEAELPDNPAVVESQGPPAGGGPGAGAGMRMGPPAGMGPPGAHDPTGGSRARGRPGAAQGETADETKSEESKADDKKGEADQKQSETDPADAKPESGQN